MSKETQSRPVLCMNCSCWEVAPNVELGTCTIKQDDEVITHKLLTMIVDVW
jgi:hypothetical protein